MAAPGSSEEEDLFAEVLQANGLDAGSQLSNVSVLQLYGVNLPKVRHPQGCCTQTVASELRVN